jgi:hypothetical protein
MGNLLLKHDKSGPICVVGPSLFEKLGCCPEAVQDDPFGAKCLKEEYISLYGVGQKEESRMLVNATGNRIFKAPYCTPWPTHRTA